MDYKYHDIKKAEALLENGFFDGYYKSNSKFIALYYRDVLGYKPKKRKEELVAFFENNIKDYSIGLYYKVINSAINYSKNKKKKLIEIDYIPVYKSEVEYINNLPIDYDLKKIIFTFLVKIKISKAVCKILNDYDNTDYFVSSNVLNDKILKLANLTKKKNKVSPFYQLEQLKYTTTYVTGTRKLNILYEMPVDTTEIALKIEDYINIGYYFDYYNGKNNIKLCEICNKPYKATGKNNKYCKEHQGYIKVETKTVVCCDCGKEFEVDARNTTKVRCDECQKIYRNQKAKERMRKNRNK